MLVKLIMVRQGADLQLSTISQMEVAKFFEQYNLDFHIQKIIDLYRGKRDLLMKTIKEESSGEATYTYPEGGMSYYIK